MVWVVILREEYVDTQFRVEFRPLSGVQTLKDTARTLPAILSPVAAEVNSPSLPVPSLQACAQVS